MAAAPKLRSLPPPRQWVGLATFQRGHVDLDGTLAAAQCFPAGSRPFFVVTGDFNADGLDIAVTNVGSPESAILLNAGNWGE